jgi:hypothetical protein
MNNNLGLPWLLRAWRRDIAQLSLEQAAAKVGISMSAVSQWETGQRGTARGISRRHLQALDDCYAADGALVDLALALGTPSGLPPRTTWAHNFQGPGGPVWAWLRPGFGRHHTTARLLWGAFRFDCTQGGDARGLIVTSPTSMPNPAVWVHLRDPGWVDFGRGEVPETLGIPTLDALSGAQIGDGGHSPAGLVSPAVIARFNHDPEWADEVLQFFGTRADLVTQVFNGTAAHDRIVNLTTQAPTTVSSETLNIVDYRALRECRNLSRAEVAAAATDLMPEEPITDDQVALLERGGNPRPRFLRTRLDLLYRADGHTCLEVVKAQGSRSPYMVNFPDFWIGPVWFTFAAGSDPCGEARLEWGPNRKRMYLQAGTTVTCRRPTPEPVPFLVYCPDTWTVTAGMGAHPRARDINWGWHRADNDQPERPDVNEVFLSLFGQTTKDFNRLL